MLSLGMHGMFEMVGDIYIPQTFHVFGFMQVSFRAADLNMWSVDYKWSVAI